MGWARFQEYFPLDSRFRGLFGTSDGMRLQISGLLDARWYIGMGIVLEVGGFVLWWIVLE